MKQSRFSEEQIIGILKEHEAGPRRRSYAVVGCVRRHFTNGSPNSVGWKFQTPSVYVPWKGKFKTTAPNGGFNVEQGGLKEVLSKKW